MVDVSLTTFIDFVAANGTAKITRVKTAKQFYEDDTPFHVRWHYHQLVRAIKDAIRHGGDIEVLEQCVAKASARRRSAYRANVDGFTTWLGRNPPTWTGVRSRRWRAGELTVKVNPELGVVLAGRRHVIKLYLKAEKMAQRKLDPSLHLLQVTHGTSENEVGILDVRRAKLYRPTRAFPGIDALLEGEARSLAHIWQAM